jgi:protein-L-isoaspartate(D-aspartate) O-methyltransferase
VTATAEGSPPQALLDQLAPDGVLVCPVRRDGDERLMRFRGDGSIEPGVAVRFVPLIEDTGGD